MTEASPSSRTGHRCVFCCVKYFLAYRDYDSVPTVDSSTSLRSKETIEKLLLPSGKCVVYYFPGWYRKAKPRRLRNRGPFMPGLHRLTRLVIVMSHLVIQRQEWAGCDFGCPYNSTYIFRRHVVIGGGVSLASPLYRTMHDDGACV